MTNGSNQNPKPSDPPFDLEERSAQFGEAVIDLCKKVPLGPLTNRLVDQLIGASSSIGANYCEADDAVSKKDFRHKISISKREARESKHFLGAVQPQSQHGEPVFPKKTSLGVL